MNTHRTDLSIDNLQKAFSTAFNWIVARDRETGVEDFAGAWVELVASALQDVRLTATPAIEHDSPPLKFLQTHRIATDLFFAARSGMRGGPMIDVLLQVWFDTEEMFCGYGFPLIFRTIPHSGRMPELMWSELQDACRKVTLATPCARVVLVAKDRDFDWYGSDYRDKNPIIAADAHSIAGQRLPPAPVRGRRLDTFCQDLASGWTGDPALSGMESSAILDEVMTNFQISHVLRIRIVRENPEDVWRPAPLPF